MYCMIRLDSFPRKISTLPNRVYFCNCTKKLLQDHENVTEKGSHLYRDFLLNYLFNS